MKIAWNDAASNPPNDNRDVIAYVPRTPGLFYIAHHDLGDYIVRVNDQEIVIEGVTRWIDLPEFINPSFID